MGNDFFTGGNAYKTGERQKDVTSLTVPESGVKRAGKTALGWVVSNHSVIISVILILFAIVVLITTELKLDGAFWQNVVSANTILLATCSYLLYINGYRTGGATAEKSDFVTSVKTAYIDIIAEVRKKKIEWMLELFCAEYRKDELRNAKTEILLCAGFTEKQITAFFAGDSENAIDITKLSKPKLKAYNQAKKLKPIRLTKSMLVNSLTAHRGRNPIRSAGAIEVSKWSGFLVKAVTVVISCVFVVSLSLQLTTDFSLKAVIYALFQIVLLLVSLFGGVFHGNKIKIKYTERLQDVIGVLYEFNEWLERRKTTKSAEETAQNEG